MSISTKGIFNTLRLMNLVGCVLYISTADAHEEIVLESDLRPMWEAGAFTAVFNSPVYPAANQNQTNLIPSPYFIYRGKTFRIGESSIARAVAVNNDWYELDLSLAGSFNANSEDNSARVGMPDLDFIFELGPQLKMRLKQLDFKRQGKGELFLTLQARAAFSTDAASINKRGFVFQPELSYRQRGWLSEKTALSMTISPTWTTEKLQDYFYQVDNEFATNERQAFDATGGYLGTKVSLGLSFNATKDIRIFLGASSSIHSGAANENSPLFKDSHTDSFRAGMVWRLWQSEERVSGR